MKIFSFILIISFVAIRLVALSQQKLDSIQYRDQNSKLSSKELRKEKDSITKSLTPIPDKAIVYIVRPGFLGMAIPLRLDCDCFQVGWIHTKTYFYTILSPGEHIFKASSENEYYLKVNLEPGKIYYLEQEARRGVMYARTKIKPLNSEKGEKYLLKCTISKQNRYPQFLKSKDIEKPSATDE